MIWYQSYNVIRSYKVVLQDRNASLNNTFWLSNTESNESKLNWSCLWRFLSELSTKKLNRCTSAASRLFWSKIHIFLKLYINRCRIPWTIISPKLFWYQNDRHKILHKLISNFKNMRIFDQKSLEIGQRLLTTGIVRRVEIITIWFHVYLNSSFTFSITCSHFSK